MLLPNNIILMLLPDDIIHKIILYLPQYSYSLKINNINKTFKYETLDSALKAANELCYHFDITTVEIQEINYKNEKYILKCI